MLVQIAILHSATEIELASGLRSGIETVCCPGNDIAGSSGSTADRESEKGSKSMPLQWTSYEADQVSDLRN